MSEPAQNLASMDHSALDDYMAGVGAYKAQREAHNPDIIITSPMQNENPAYIMGDNGAYSDGVFALSHPGNRGIAASSRIATAGLSVQPGNRKSSLDDPMVILNAQNDPQQIPAYLKGRATRKSVSDAAYEKGHSLVRPDEAPKHHKDTTGTLASHDRMGQAPSERPRSYAVSHEGATLSGTSGRKSKTTLKKDQDNSVNASHQPAKKTSLEQAKADTVIGAMAHTAQKVSDALEALALNTKKASTSLLSAGTEKEKRSGTITSESRKKKVENPPLQTSREKAKPSVRSALKTASGKHRSTTPRDQAGDKSLYAGSGSALPRSSQKQVQRKTGNKKDKDGIRLTSNDELRKAHEVIVHNDRLFSPDARHSVEGVDMDYMLGALAMQESHGNPEARSKAGAEGLMQLMPGTAKEVGVTNPFDPVQSWQGAGKYLARLLHAYHGDPDRVEKAIAAYNWGPGNMRKDIRENGDNWRDGLKKNETRDYINRFASNIARGHVVRIENYTGQNLVTSSRRAAIK